MNLVLSMLIVHFLYHILFKPKQTTLNCGLFGGSFNQPINELMMEKLKLLGLLNMSRGKDSCGYYNGDVLIKGTGKNKEFYDLVVSNGVEYNTKGENNIFIGHTRSASVGFNLNEANAHPFNIKDKLILAHNGTISNIDYLCTEHEIDDTDLHVDSLALGHLLLKCSYKILEEYVGGAALSIHRIKEPDVMYLYHGHSRQSTSTYVESVEERPLFWMKAAVGIYYSSLKSSLEYIRNPQTDEEPETVPHNMIFRIRKGKIADKPVSIIDRSRINEKVEIKKYEAPVRSYNSHTHFAQQGHFPLSKRYQDAANSQLDIFKGDSLNILEETIPTKNYNKKGFVFFLYGRYWEEFGKICEGYYTLDKKTGEVLKDDSSSYLAIKYFFFKGVMINRIADINRIKNLVDLKTGHDYCSLTYDTFNFAKYISEYTDYPVTNMQNECISPEMRKDKILWYLGGKLAAEGSKRAFTPKFSDRDYHYFGGKLIKVKTTNNQIAFKHAIEDAVVVEDTTDAEINKLINSAITYSDEVNKAANRFHELYSTHDNAVVTLGGYCMDALDFYMEDIVTEILMVEYTSKLGATLIRELIEHSIDKKVSIYSLLDPNVESIESYLNDVMHQPEPDEDDAPNNIMDKAFENDIELENRIANQIDSYSDATNPNYHIDEVDDLTKLQEELKDEEIGQKLQDMEDKLTKDEERQMEEQEASDLLDKLLPVFKDIKKLESEYQLLNQCDLAQSISQELSGGMNELLCKIKEKYQGANKTEAVMKINKLLTH